MWKGTYEAEMIRAGSIMTKDVVTISKEADIMDAARLMVDRSISGIVVVEKGQPLDIISEEEVLSGIILNRKKVKDVMSGDFITISPNTKISEIRRMVRDRKVKRFPVMENDRIVGIITETDLIQAEIGLTRFNYVVQEILLLVFGLATAFFLFYFSPLGAGIFG